MASGIPVLFGHDLNGPTFARPINAEPGQPFFDTTINKQLFWNGFTWITASPSQATITIAASNSPSAIGSDFICTGKTVGDDDSATMQAAVNAAGSVGAELLWKTGTYFANSTGTNPFLNLPSTNITMRGETLPDSPGDTSTCGPTIIHTGGGYGIGCTANGNGLRIIGLRLRTDNGSGSLRGDGRGIYLVANTMNKPLIAGCVLEGYDRGIEITADSPNLFSCVFDTCGKGLLIAGCYAANVKDGWYSNCSTYGIWNFSSIHSEMHSNRFQGCALSCQLEGPLGNFHDNTIYYAGTGGDGISIDYGGSAALDPSGSRVAGNIISLADPTQPVINNTVGDCIAIGKIAGPVSKLIIVDNLLRNGGSSVSTGWAVNFQGSSTNNLCKNNSILDAKFNSGSATVKINPGMGNIVKDNIGDIQQLLQLSTADPHINGSWYNNGGTFTKSTG